VLKQICAQFTEGHDKPELMAAVALLSRQEAPAINKRQFRVSSGPKGTGQKE